MVDSRFLCTGLLIYDFKFFELECYYFHVHLFHYLLINL